MTTNTIRDMIQRCDPWENEQLLTILEAQNVLISQLEARIFQLEKQTVPRKPVERALRHLCLDNTKLCKESLLKALNLIEAEPEKDVSYTFKSKP